MAAICSSRSLVAAPRVASSRRVAAVRPAARMVVKASAQQQQKQLSTAVTLAVGAAMASPLMAEASVTPSLRNFLYSLVAGGTVLTVIVAGVTFVSTFDPVKRD